MICAGNKLCCDRCGQELRTITATDRIAVGTWPAYCPDHAACERRYREYLAMARRIYPKREAITQG